VAVKRGQATVEYLLFLAVVAVALVAAAYAFIPAFGQGVDGLADDLQELLQAGSREGSSEMR
jgi:Flp pilus assembly pilin Flp